MDDPFISCPYEPNHRVPRSRIQGHIVKCQKNYPELAICPFNATHRYPAAQIKHHVANCPTKQAMFPEDVPAKAAGALTKPKPILQKEYLPETDPNHEIWDN
ncbi:gametocyte-specific factor 1-like [Leguminivora glycinivorella]|uniref:gametocyte-specific factor 1-like n=1 Tax=Leguminivora glycinivorella TaxID=1035111 RepID=UPI0020101A5E|nr:gametocyte-specific factor 1-like [Leguminivora glycinivorella]XP_048003491.1 gametocyte-specific factor 1-like [Leguminivora glycinivorella]